MLVFVSETVANPPTIKPAKKKIQATIGFSMSQEKDSMENA